MARPSSASIFLRKLKDLGGVAGNSALRNQLGWSADKYTKVRQQLCDVGAVARGRGRGGSVILRAPEDQESVPEILENLPDSDAAVGEVLIEALKDAEARSPTRERDLYGPVKDQLSLYLKQQKGLQEICVQVTALQGSRDTGGSWSRPDLVAIGIRRYVYLPDKSVEVYSFEVKSSNDVTVKGVLEALSHRESATHSYVVYHTDGRDWDAFPEAQRIEQIAARYGVGVIVATEIGNAEDWDERVVASRSNADPDVLYQVPLSLTH